MTGFCGGCGRCCGFRLSSGRRGSRGSRSSRRSAASPRPRERPAMELRHEQIARIALAAGARYGLALAGGYAVSAHRMGDRPSGDVASFTSWQHRGEFPELTAAVVATLEAAGYKVSVIMSAETFTRLILADPEGGTEEKVELSVDWRAHDPVQLAIGPVLHADDADGALTIPFSSPSALSYMLTMPSPTRSALSSAAPRPATRLPGCGRRRHERPLHTRATAGPRRRCRPRLRPAAVRRRARGANTDYRRRVRRVPHGSCHDR